MGYRNDVKAVKSKAFAVRIVNLCKYLRTQKREFHISHQLLRAGTSIGANIREAYRGQSKADFISKCSIAQKEAEEACYWLELLYETGYLNDREFNSIYRDAEELVKILAYVINSSKA